jgi:hypothetical protein
MNTRPARPRGGSENNALLKARCPVNLGAFNEPGEEEKEGENGGD